MIRILVVDDNAIVRQGLGMLLATESDFNVVMDAPDGATALDLLNSTSDIDIVLVDFNMPGMDGLALTRHIVESNHPVKVIVLTMHKQIIFRDKVLAGGAKGYLLKGEDAEDLFTGIRAVYNGQIFVSPALAGA